MVLGLVSLPKPTGASSVKADVPGAACDSLRALARLLARQAATETLAGTTAAASTMSNSRPTERED